MSQPAGTPAAAPSIPAGTSIGHVHLRVADLDRAIRFYRDVMGFDLQFTLGGAAFLSAGGYHHHLGLNTWESLGGSPPPPGTTGLYHFCILYPTRRDLATALVRLLDAGWGIDGASDHTSHEAIYLHDPDHNGIELAWDRDPDYWRPRYAAAMADPNSPAARRVFIAPLDFDGLLSELEDGRGAAYLPALRAYR
jgi:catechol 2,3-dioxygenase